MPMKFGLSAVAAAIAVTSMSTSPSAVAQTADWAMLLANAKKEGTVVVHGTPGSGIL